MLTFGLALLLAASDAPKPSSPAAVPEKPKKICRNVERTGTRMSKRKCLTADEWAVEDRGDTGKLDVQNQQFKQNTHDPLGGGR
jgi:hypothetical protein